MQQTLSQQTSDDVIAGNELEHAHAIIAKQGKQLTENQAAIQTFHLRLQDINIALAQSNRATYASRSPLAHYKSKTRSSNA